MSLDGFLGGLKKGLNDVTGALNVVDRYTNPFHVEAGSARTGDTSHQGLFAPVVTQGLNPTVEQISKALTWTKDNVISQPISTALLAGELPGGPFKASNWAISWHAANHISPGQALFLNPSQTQQAVNAPLDYYKPQSAYLPPGFDQLPKEQQNDLLRKAGMPAVGNSYIDELRQSSSLFKNATGISDFAFSWYSDPAVLGGKAAGAARRKLTTFEMPAEGWSKADIDKIVNTSKMGKAIDFLHANRSNPQLLNNTRMAQESGMGPRFGGIVSQLQTKEDVADFLRVGMGDQDALEKLTTRNQAAAARFEQDSARYSRLDQMRTTYADNTAVGREIQRNMDKLTDQMNADQALVKSYNGVLEHAGELDKIVWTRRSVAQAQARTAAQNTYRARAARGAKAGTLGREVTINPTPIISTGANRQVNLGVTKTRLWGAGDFFSSPVTILRSFGEARPNGYMRIDDVTKDDMAELQGQLARIPGITETTRRNFLNKYLNTSSEGERVDILNDVGRLGAAKVAEKHGLSPEAGAEIYQEHLKRQAGEVDNLKRYSAAKRIVQLDDGQYTRLNVDEFTVDGGKVVLHPNLVTKLTQGHVFQDLDELDRTLARHTSALSAIRESRLGNPDWVSDAFDYLTHLFKFGTLFRLGYIPRVLGDDLTGQWARAGAAAMAMRFGWGVRNGATNVALWANRPWEEAQAHAAQAGADFAGDRIQDIDNAIHDLQRNVTWQRQGRRLGVTNAGRKLAAAQEKLNAMDPATTPPARLAAMQTLVSKHQAALDEATRAMGTGPAADVIKLRDLEAHRGWLAGQQKQYADRAAQHRANAARQKQIQGNRPITLPDGRQAPGAFQGREGEYYQQLVSADQALGQIFETNKQIIHGHLTRSFDHGGKAISAAQDTELHAQSWARAINTQLAQDQLARMAIRGATPEEMTNWLTHTINGRAYFERLGLRQTDPETVALNAWHEVDEYMPLQEIKQQALTEEGVSPAFLKEAVPDVAARPEVHTGQVGSTQNRYKRALDDVTDRWFKVASTIPANRLSRHPLFAQLYQGHMTRIANQLKKQSAYDSTVQGANDMATTARRLALRDMRKLVFDISHRSDASAAMRFMMPFMTATNESFQRWGRIIADKPQVIGYGNLFYNAPAARGSLQDSDGNHIDRYGNAYVMQYPTLPNGDLDYDHGKAVKVKVPKGQRYIVGRVPSWVAKSPLGVAFGMDFASGDYKLSQNSMDLVTQGDPWFSPGFGPIVQVPVNEFTKDKPKDAELAQKIGILPFGPQQSSAFGNNVLGRAAGFFAPNTIKNFLTAYDTTDERYQQVKWQIMQKAIFEHDNMGKPMPSPSKIAKMTRDYWLFSATSAFLQPFATQRQDPYQFYRDQYNLLLNQDPKSADDKFIDRYGESYFIFAQSMSKNATGIQPTDKAVELERKYGDLIAKNPELGALIVGPDGNGPFSSAAYSYQLNQPLTPGSSEMQRSRMSADEMLADNNRRRGWADYTRLMNKLNADLRSAGFQSFSDRGAQGFKAEKTAISALLGSPTLPDGATPNPFYNEDWSKDFNSLDTMKYERLIPGLQAVANSDLAKEPNRSDLRVLQNYLTVRQALTQILAQRKQQGGSGTITAQSNADLLDAWQKIVDNFIESNTNFGDLHTRYLARDLGYNDQTEAA